LAGAALTQLLEMYDEKMIMTPPLVDSLGREVKLMFLMENFYQYFFYFASPLIFACNFSLEI